MATQPIPKLKETFSDNKEPNGQDFANLIDSFDHKSVPIAQTRILGLQQSFDAKAEKVFLEQTNAKVNQLEETKASKDELASVVGGLNPMGDAENIADLNTKPKRDKDSYFVKDQLDPNGDPYIFKYDVGIGDWINTKQVVYQNIARKTDQKGYEVSYAPNGLMPQWAVVSNGVLNIDTVNEKIVLNGELILSWGKGYTFISADNIEVPFDNSSGYGMTGLIAVFYVRKTKTFRFLPYSSFAEITNDYLLIAVLQNKNLIYTASKIQLNGEYQSLVDVDNRVKSFPNAWCTIISGFVNVDTVNAKVTLSGSTVIQWGKTYAYKTFDTEVSLTGGSMEGLSVLYYDKKNSVFRFIRYDGGLSEVTQDYLIVAVFQSTKLVTTLSNIRVNNKQALDNSTNKPYLNKKWGIIGDSITTQASVINDDGSYTVNRTNWTTHAEKFFEPKEWHNMAMSGGHYCNFASATPFQKMEKQVAVLTANFKDLDYIVISLGTNDMSSKHTLGSYETAMGKSIDELDLTVFYDALRYCYFKLREAYSDAVIFVATPLQIADFDSVYAIRKPYYEAIEAMAKRYNCILIDACNESGIISDFEVKNGSGKYLSDGLHPNATGKAFHGDFMIKKIASHL